MESSAPQRYAMKNINSNLRVSLIYLFKVGIYLCLMYAGLALFKIQSLNCQVGNQPCPTALQTELETNLLGKSLFFTDFNRVLSKNSSFSEYTLVNSTKTLSGQLGLYLTDEPTLYQLKLATGEVKLISTQGRIKFSSPTQNDHAPTIDISTATGPTSLTSLESLQVPAEFHQPASQLINSLYKHEFPIQNIEWHSATEIKFLIQEVTVILDQTDPEADIAALKQILQSAEVANLEKPVWEIDMRFDLPVLRTRP